MWLLGFGGGGFPQLQHASLAALTSQQLPPQLQHVPGAKPADVQQALMHSESQAHALQAMSPEEMQKVMEQHIALQSEAMAHMQLQLQAASSVQPALVGQVLQSQQLAQPSGQSSSKDSNGGYSIGRKAGIMDRVKGSFGFIKQDSGEDDIFVMPLQCAAFGNNFPPLGARVIYEVGVSNRTGKPIAENVRIGYSGTMDRIKGGFGFIKQDSGEDDIFVMPLQCPAFGGSFPPIGSRVVYEVGVSSRTGKAIAEDVQAEERGAGLAVAGCRALQNLSAGGALSGQLALQNNVPAISQAAPQMGQLALQNGVTAVSQCTPQMLHMLPAPELIHQSFHPLNALVPSDGPINASGSAIDESTADIGQLAKRRKLEE